MSSDTGKFFGKDFWITEANKYYRRPYLRLEKCARLVISLAGQNECDLLDIGCGPAALQQLLPSHVHYYGIDLAIHVPQANLLEVDITQKPIGFGDRKFDIAVATGLFEYMGQLQKQKMSEIRDILKERAKFIVSFTNYNHQHALVDYAPYNNVMSIEDFKRDLELFFHVDCYFPTFYNWNGTEPRKWWSRGIQKYVNVKVPFISRRLSVSYFFVCSPKPTNT